MMQTFFTNGSEVKEFGTWIPHCNAADSGRNGNQLRCQSKNWLTDLSLIRYSRTATLYLIPKSIWAKLKKDLQIMSKHESARHFLSNSGADPQIVEKSMHIAKSKTEMHPADPREFIRLLMENERRIYAYIRTLLGNSTDAEDVLQETSIILWDKFSSFDQNDGNFIAWSFKIAFFTCQNFRRKKGRSKVLFSDQLVNTIAEKTHDMVDELDERQEHLANCIEKLSAPDRKLLRLRYDLNSSIEATAEQCGRTKQAVYKALSRMRAALFNCVNKAIAAHGAGH